MANLPTSIKNLNTLLGEQLTEGGGGGSSDFSTATVTFICNASDGVTVSMAMIKEPLPPFEPEGRSYGLLPLAFNDELEATALLYNGKCLCNFANATSASGTGDILHIDEKEAIITGDCTITIS